jgi:hypothetical protein
MKEMPSSSKILLLLLKLRLVEKKMKLVDKKKVKLVE